MQVSKRSLTLYLLSTVMLLCLLLSSGLMFLNNSTVYASSESIAQSTEFFVVDGASVRTQEGRSGIRFTAKIAKSYYDENKESTSWGFIIGTNLVDKANLTYDKAVDTSEASVELHENITPIEEGNYYVLRVKFVYDNNELTSSEMAQKYVDNLSARAYFKDSSNKVTYAYTNDTTRSITEVAENVLLEDALADEAIYDNADFISNKSVLEGYVINNAYAHNVEKEAYIFKDGDDFKITGVNTAFASQSLIFNGKSIGTKTITEGELTLTAVEISDMTLGSYYALSYFDQDGFVVQQSVQYVTEVITNENISCGSTAEGHSHTNFNRITQLITETYYYTGGKVYAYNLDNTAASGYTSGAETTLPTEMPYYVLAEDVTFTKPRDNYGASWSPIFHGVLDGKGHTITFETVDTNANKRTLSGGVFNYLSVGSALKNVEFLFPTRVTSNGKNSGLSSGAIAREFLGNNSIENVVISINNVAFTSGGSQPLVAKVLNNVTMEDVVINVKTMPSDATLNATLDVIGIGGGLKDGNSFNNVKIYTNTAYTGNTTNNAGFALIADITDGVISDATYAVDGITVSYLKDNGTTEPTRVGTWLLDTTKTVAITDFAQSQFAPKKLELKKDNYAAEFLKIEFKEEAYLEANGKLSGVVNDGTYVASINGVSIGEVIVTEGVVENVSVNGLTLGEAYLLEIASGSTTYSQPVQYVTEVISTDDRLSAILGTNESSEGDLPYYVLRNENGKNFTYTKPVQNFGSSIVFHGILNGKGNTIDFVNGGDGNNRTLAGGLFNKLSQRSQIKNVEFVIPRYDANNSSSSLYSGALAREFLGDNVLENVVITIKTIKWQIGTEGSRPYYLLAATLNDVSLNNVLINLGSIGSSSDYVFALGCDLTDVSNIKNVNVIYPADFAQKTIGEIVIATSSNKGEFKSSGTLYYAKNSGIEESIFIPSVDGNPAQPAKKLLSGVNVYFSNDLEDVPAKVGAWNISASSFGKDAVANYDKSTVATDEFIVNDKTVSVNNTLRVDKLVSSQGVYSGTVRFRIANDSVVTYDKEKNTFIAKAAGQTMVKYSYQINGIVYVKEFTVNVVAS